MTRKPVQKQKKYTAQDHRPMIPEFRMPGDVLDAVVRKARRDYEEMNPNYKQNWR